MLPIVIVHGKPTRLALAVLHPTVAVSISNVRMLAAAQTTRPRAATASTAGASVKHSEGARRPVSSGPERRRPGSPPCDGGQGSHFSSGSSGSAASLGGLLPAYRIAVRADGLTGRLVVRAERARSTPLVFRVEKPG